MPLMGNVEQSLGLGALFAIRGAVPAPQEALIVGIDEDSARALGTMPTRAMHAQLVTALARGGATAIVFDLFLHTESPDDAEFSTALSAAGNVVLTARIERGRVPGLDVQTLQVPAPTIAAQAIGVAPWLVPEDFRVDWVFTRDDFGRPTMPLMVLQLCELESFMDLLHAVRPDVAARLPATRAALAEAGGLGPLVAQLRREFSDDVSLAGDLRARAGGGSRALVDLYAGVGPFGANRLFLSYYGPPRSFATVSYQDMLARALRGDDLDVEGKVVFVGYSAERQPGQQDDYPYVYSTDGFNLSGVELGATAFENLLHGRDVRVVPLLARDLLLALWGVAIAACIGLFRVRLATTLVIVASVAYAMSAALAFAGAALWLPIVVPAAQLLFATMLGLRLKQLTDRALLGVGAGEEAALALTGRGKPEKVDHRVVLFADEQGSKKRLRRALEELDAARRRALQSDLAIARDVPIADHGGRINHELADSMLAYWLTPDADDAAAVASQMDSACGAALAIHTRVAALSDRYAGFGLALRLGLDWGEVTSRLNPSPEIKDWKMEGAPIHVAERLESLNKALGTMTLISQALAARIDRRRFHTLELGTFVFCDGEGEIVVDPVRVHELRLLGEVSATERGAAVAFEEALAALRQCDWTTGLTRFEALAADGRRHADLAARYAVWCRRTLEETDTRWRGVVMVTFSDKSQYLDRFV